MFSKGTFFFRSVPASELYVERLQSAPHRLEITSALVINKVAVVNLALLLGLVVAENKAFAQGCRTAPQILDEALGLFGTGLQKHPE
mmetsp:Transcript_14756/g.32560  ORF Transcript_14756/g.32560 Transcript_14756/m.32560 type:complete len:87 (-) Transcript_14756:318-578(-)